PDECPLVSARRAHQSPMPPAHLVSEDRPLMGTLPLTAGPQANHDGKSRTWEVATPTRRVLSPWWGQGRLNGWRAKRKGVPRNV
ncbi:MAG: hypothetical protein ACYDGY_02475, partial [Acidimicrobiales bacterium]